MSKKNNVYIKKARRRRTIKRFIIFAFILMISGWYIIFRTDIFKITTVECVGDNLLTKDFVTQKVESLNGENLFSVSEQDVEDLLKENPYVKSITVNKKYPKSLVVSVTEASGLYYINEGSSYGIVSKGLVLLERTSSIEGKKLIEIKGIDITGKTLGEKIEDNTRVEKLLEEFYKEEEIIRKNEEIFSINSIEIKDLSQIKANFGQIVIILGNDEDIRTKMSNAIKVYKSGLAKEYINVSSNGSPSYK